MKAIVFALRSFGREIRSGEVLVLLAAVSLAVASLTAVGFLTDRIGKAVALQANEVLAADLRLRSQAPIPDDWRAVAEDYDLDTADKVRFPSVVFFGDDSALSQVTAVSDAYPLRGNVRTATALLGNEGLAEGIPAPGEIWAEGALLARIGADVGDVLEVGELQLTVSAVLTYRPDQSMGFASMAPTLLMNIDDVAASGLIGEGSRAQYTLLVAGEDENVDSFYTAVEEQLPDEIRTRTAEDSSERAYEEADRAQRFLSFTAIVALLLSAVAIAMSARRFAHRRMDAVALMKSLGGTQGFVISVSLVQLLILGVLGVIIGSIVGYVAEEILARIIVDLMAGELPDAGFKPVVLASGSAMVLLLGFALPSLIQLRNTPPLRVLRHDEMPPAPSRLLVGGLSLAAVCALLYRSVGDPKMLVYLIGGIIVIAGSLYLVGRAMVALVGRSRSGVGVAWRYGLANVSRRGRDSAVQVVAFGLSITVLLLLTLVRTDLLDAWRDDQAENTPNHFLINIQPHETESVGSLFAEAGIEVPTFTPMVRGRMSHINGESVKDRTYPNPDGAWLANREANLSWAARLSSSNEIVTGEWWSPDYDGPPLASVEDEAARNTGLAVGDEMTFTVAGREVTAKIASTRKIDWNSFQPNFFIVMSPGALEEMPHTFISSSFIEEEKQAMLIGLMRQHPAVSVIDLGAILEQVRGIIEKGSLAVQAVFIFTLAAGIAVLFAAVQSTIDERRFESAMLRALGARRRTVFAGVMAEFAALGAAAGILASVGASVLAWLVSTRLFELPYSFDPLVWLAGIGAGILVVCLSGYFAARGAVNAMPVEVLRGAA